MSWRDWWSWGREVKENPVSNLIVMGLGGDRQPVSPKTSLRTQTDEGYQQNATVFGCVNLISRNGAQVPLILTRTERRRRKQIISRRTAARLWARGGLQRKAVERSEVEDHPLLRLLERPNPRQGGAAFVQQALAFLHINGNSYIVSVGPDDQRKPPLELYGLRPDRMRIIPAASTTETLVGGYEYRAPAGGKRTFEPEEIVHIPLFSPLDDFYGLSPIQVAARVIDTDNSALVWNQNLLQNDARPPSVITIEEGFPSKSERERFDADLERRYTGTKNARRPVVIEGKAKWDQLGLSPADLDWLEGRKLSQREIAAKIYHVPPELLGDPEAKTYNSMPEAKKALYTEAVLPGLDRVLDDLNAMLTVRFDPTGDLQLGYDADQIEALQEDMERKWVRVHLADSLSLNEQRAAIGYDDYTGDPEADDPADVPVALRPRRFLRDERRAPRDVKAQRLTREQRAARTRVREFLSRQFEAQGKALATFLRKKIQARRETRSQKATLPTAAEIRRMLTQFDWDKELFTPGLSTLRQEVVRSQGTRRARQLGITFDSADPFVLREMTRYLGARIVQLDRTTRDEVIALIARTLAEHRTVTVFQLGTKIGDAVREKFGDYQRFRADRIARTETANVYNQADVFSYRQAGISKVEVSDGDDDADCADANGQIWTLERAMNNPTAHPNCTRSFAPVVDD